VSIDHNIILPEVVEETIVSIKEIKEDLAGSKEDAKLLKEQFTAVMMENNEKFCNTMTENCNTMTENNDKFCDSCKSVGDKLLWVCKAIIVVAFFIFGAIIYSSHQ